MVVVVVVVKVLVAVSTYSMNPFVLIVWLKHSADYSHTEPKVCFAQRVNSHVHVYPGEA